MGSTEAFLSINRAKARLWEYDYVLSRQAQKKWQDITKALIPLKETVQTTTRKEDAESWLSDYVNSKPRLPLIENEDDINEIFGAGLNSMAIDGKGRLYVRLTDVTRYCRALSGLPGVNTKTVARDLVKLGFKKHQFNIKENDKRKQIFLWYSEPGFVKWGRPLDEITVTAEDAASHTLGVFSIDKSLSKH